jgi:hypothetical protein
MNAIEIIERAIERTVARTEHLLGKSLPDVARDELIFEMATSLALVLAAEEARGRKP